MHPQISLKPTYVDKNDERERQRDKETEREKIKIPKRKYKEVDKQRGNLLCEVVVRVEVDVLVEDVLDEEPCEAQHIDDHGVAESAVCDVILTEARGGEGLRAMQRGKAKDYT